MTDYLQPDFYRFNEDSLLLVNEIAGLKLEARNLLDIGAGSGVIGIELAQKLGIKSIHFLELQREWEPVLKHNIENYLDDSEIKIFWGSVGEWNPETKYSLIVSNPPYYLPEKGRISPDPVRAKCRSFLEDDWEILLNKSFSALAAGGSAFFVTALENLGHVSKIAGQFPHEIIQKKNVLILRISSEYK